VSQSRGIKKQNKPEALVSVSGCLRRRGGSDLRHAEVGRVEHRRVHRQREELLPSRYQLAMDEFANFRLLGDFLLWAVL
jgi:hypothetical protein